MIKGIFYHLIICLGSLTQELGNFSGNIGTCFCYEIRANVYVHYFVYCVSESKQHQCASLGLGLHKSNSMVQGLDDQAVLLARQLVARSI